MPEVPAGNAKVVENQGCSCFGWWKNKTDNCLLPRRK
jgi:hypothetical protein